MTGDGRRQPISPLLAGFLAGAAIAVMVGVMAKINLDFAAPWQSTHTLSAQISDADGIAVGSDVRVAGRPVGQVTDVTAQGTSSRVTFHLSDDEWPLPSDTTASIRLATLLGQKYLELVPGHSRSAIADDGVIGLAATKPVVDFDQILNTFDQPTRDSLTSLIRTASGALQGQEGTLQQVIPTWRALAVDSQASTAVLDTRNSDINSILVNLGTTADQLNQSRHDLAGVIDNLNSITGALATHQTALEGYIANADAVNQTTNAVLGGAGAQQLNAGLRQVGPFAAQLDILVRHLIPQTSSFRSSGADKAATNLIFEIGDATSQSNKGGYFLRQNVAGVDICGLTPLCSLGAPPSAPTLPSVNLPPVTIPPLPIPSPSLPPLPLPTLPPAICQQVTGLPLPGCPTPTPGAAPAGGLLPPLPSLPPLPTLGASPASYQSGSDPGLTEWY